MAEPYDLPEAGEKYSYSSLPVVRDEASWRSGDVLSYAVGSSTDVVDDSLTWCAGVVPCP